MHAHSTVNVHTAKVVGNAILASMKGATAANFNLKKSDQVFTLDTKAVVKIDGVTVQTDPQQFNRQRTGSPYVPVQNHFLRNAEHYGEYAEWPRPEIMHRRHINGYNSGCVP